MAICTETESQQTVVGASEHRTESIFTGLPAPQNVNNLSSAEPEELNEFIFAHLKADNNQNAYCLIKMKIISGIS